MIPFKSLITFSKASPKPLYLQLAEALVVLIREGILTPGTKLPGTRQMAQQLGISRQTVIVCFEELYAQGWMELKPASGTYVASHLPAKKEPPNDHSPLLLAYPQQAGFDLKDQIQETFFFEHKLPLCLDYGAFDIRLSPTREIARLYNKALRENILGVLQASADIRGLEVLRCAMAQLLRENRRMPIREDNILITRGSQMGIWLAAQTIIEPGDNIVTGETNYIGADRAFTKSGGKLLRVPVDQGGIDVHALEAICQRQRIKAVYVVPHHHPTTVLLAPERRLRLLELADRYDFIIIEDDFDFDFHYDNNPLLSLAGMDSHGRVIYIGSYTKGFVAPLRIGFVVAPPALITKLSYLRRIIDITGDSLMEFVFAQLIESGALKRHINRSVALYRRRRDHFCHLLAAHLPEIIRFVKPGGGLAVWATFTPAVNLAELTRCAAQRGLQINEGQVYNPEGKPLNATRLGFASLTEGEAHKAISILHSLVLEKHHN